MMEKNVLLIDDNRAMLFATQAALQGRYNPILAETGNTGIESFKKKKPDIVILDMRLPDIHGLDVLVQLKRIDPSVPVIVMTALDNTSLVSKAIRAGALDYLVKPLGLEALLNAIESAVTGNPFNSGIVLPSPVIRNVYDELARAYTENDTVVLIGEKGVGKRSLSKAIHIQFHGSDHSYFYGFGLSMLQKKASIHLEEKTYTTGCVHVVGTQGLSALQSLNLNKICRKIIIAVETPSFDRNQEYKMESIYADKWKTILVPPLRLRKAEILPLFWFWHHKFSPNTSMNISESEKRLKALEEENFPGNVSSIVNLAKETA